MQWKILEFIAHWKTHIYIRPQSVIIFNRHATFTHKNIGYKETRFGSVYLQNIRCPSMRISNLVCVAQLSGKGG